MIEQFKFCFDNFYLKSKVYNGMCKNIKLSNLKPFWMFFLTCLCVFLFICMCISCFMGCIFFSFPVCIIVSVIRSLTLLITDFWPPTQTLFYFIFKITTYCRFYYMQVNYLFLFLYVASSQGGSFIIFLQLTTIFDDMLWLYFTLKSFFLGRIK